VLARDPQTALPAKRNDFKISEILHLIQRINREKIEEVRELQHIIDEKDKYINHLQTNLAGAISSRGWRAIRRVRGVLRSVKRSVLAPVRGRRRG
jgi:hypothetical protein